MKIKNLVIAGARGKPITLDVFYNDDGLQKPVVMYAHGFNGFKDWGGFDLAAHAMQEAGLTVVKFNFSHNGTTPGQPEDFTDLEAFGNNNYTKQLTDLKLVTDWICNNQTPHAHAFDLNNINLIGHSMGGGIAIIYASEDSRIKKLVTWAAISKCQTPWGNWPATRIEEWRKAGVQFYTNTRTGQQLPMYFQLYLDYVNNQERLDIKNAISKLGIPILICHGTSDISVPVEQAYQLAEWQPNARLFTLDTNHVFDRAHPWTKASLPEAMNIVLEKTIAFIK